MTKGPEAIWLGARMSAEYHGKWFLGFAEGWLEDLQAMALHPHKEEHKQRNEEDVACDHDDRE